MVGTSSAGWSLQRHLFGFLQVINRIVSRSQLRTVNFACSFVRIDCGGLDTPGFYVSRKDALLVDTAISLADANCVSAAQRIRIRGR